MKNVLTRVITATLLCFVGAALALQVQHQEPLAPLPEADAVLEVWSTAPGLDDLATMFKARHNNVVIKVKTFPTGADLYKSLQAALLRGEGMPDVARVEYAFLPWLQRSNGLLDLRNNANLGSVFVPWAWSQVSSLGGVYGVPQDIGALALLYREDIFGRYSIAAPRTWADFARVGEALQSKTKGQVKLTNFDRSSLFFAALLWAQGGRLWTSEDSGYTQTLDSVLARQMLSYWGGLIRKNIVTTLPEYSVEHWNALRSGRLASAIIPAWALGAFARNLEPAVQKGAQYRLAVLPNAGKTSSGNWGGSSLVVAKATRFPDAATAFALYSTTAADAIASMWTKESRLPAMQSGFNLAELNGSPTFAFGENPAEFYQQASSSIPEKFEWSPWLPTADAVYRKLFDSALNNQISFGQLAERWQKQTLELAWREGFTVR